MNHYQRSISEATGRTEPHELELIEDCMRQEIFHSTLDWQTKRQFNDGARKAVKLLVSTREIPPQ